MKSARPIAFLVIAWNFSFNAAYGQNLEFIVPTQPAPIRVEPPTGSLGLAGDQTSQTSTDTTYVVIGEVTVQTGFSSSQTWVRVVPLDPDGHVISDKSASGWVYWGANPDSTVNFRAPITIPQVDSDVLQRELYGGMNANGT